MTAVPPSARRFALFVSRLHPVTSLPHVFALIKPFLEGKSVVCSKMMTKCDTYSSFHLSRDESVFSAINSPQVWPEGSIFYQFFELLDLSHVDSVNPVDNEDVEHS